ncbi:MAG: DNA glycosylase AlkZ-like family protein [Acidimicrobiales bacterium]
MTTVATATELTSAQVLARRVAVQGLDRPTGKVTDLAGWWLGFQDSPAGGAAEALAARLRGGAADVGDLGDARRFTTIWATRGAPLVLRKGDVAGFAAASTPVDAADAVHRLTGNGQMLRKAKIDPREAVRTTALALREVVTGPTTKGEASKAVTPRLPKGYSAWCQGCDATHVGEQLMRLSGLAGGLRLVPGESPATLTPIDNWDLPPAEPLGAEDLVRAYLHLIGPATHAQAGAFFGTTGAAVRGLWPEDAVAVTVDGRKAWALDDDLDALADSPGPDLVRLLPRSDPWLLARDREVVVPDAARRKVLWPMIGWPGAVMVDGGVVAAWRTKADGSKLTVTVQAFESISRTVRAAIEDEAPRRRLARPHPHRCRR